MAVVDYESSFIPNGQVPFPGIYLNRSAIDAAYDLLSAFIPSEVNSIVMIEALPCRVSVAMAQVNGLVVGLHTVGKQAVSGQWETKEVRVHNRF